MIEYYVRNGVVIIWKDDKEIGMTFDEFRDIVRDFLKEDIEINEWYVDEYWDELVEYVRNNGGC